MARLIILLLFLCSTCFAQEFRALWVDAWGAGFLSPSQVTQMIADARAGNFNALVVEVRKRGDAHYFSDLEPEVDPNFDALADMIAKGHDTSGGRQRIEIHAWIVTYPIRRVVDGTNSAPANHPIRLHPDWLMTTDGGAIDADGNYNFDPGHPEVQKHTFNVCMDIISRYDIDGFNFDYIRYPGKLWGYNPVSVDRFNRLFARTGTPSPMDAAWLQFRRDQVSALVRKVYLHSAAIKPHVKISADVFTTAPYSADLNAWTNTSRAYTDVLQDWRTWMEEGFLDLNIPMTYFRMPTHPDDWFGWCNFIRDNQYNRHAAIGPGLYLNSISNSLFQMRHTRAPSPAGNTVVGVCGYDYGLLATNASRATFLDALTKTNVARLYDPAPQPLFVNRATVPEMPWKTTPTKGHIKGFVYLGNTNTPIDGATFRISSRSGVTDATGFYGSVDLTPGTYTIFVSAPNALPASNNVLIAAGAVTTADFIVSFNDTNAPVISAIQAIDVSDSSARILWSTDEPADSVVHYNNAYITNTTMVREHSILLSGLLPNTLYQYRVSSRDASGNQATSIDHAFQTNPQGVVNDLIVDNPEATIVGSWTVGNTAPGRYGADYRYKGPGTGANYVQFGPNILTPGHYAVYEWHSVGSNRTTNGQHRITHKNGTTNVLVNQQLNGGQWNYLGTFEFNTGTNGHVRITDAFNGNVVIADAIKFVFVSDPRILSIDQQGRLMIAGEPGLNYTLLGSSNLVDWAPLQTIRPTASPFQMLQPPSASQRFYKIRRD